MNCRSCNTRLTSRSGTCPNCGHSQRSTGFIDQPADRRAATESTASGPLSPSSLTGHTDADYELDDEVELPLEDSMAMGRGEAPKSKSRRTGRPATKEGSKPAAKPATKSTAKPASRAAAKGASRPAGKKSASPSRSAVARKVASPDVGGAPSFMPFDPTQLRHLVVEQPTLLEPGLTIYVDESGSEAGGQFETDIGEIDLLGRDEEHGWVIVMVADSPADNDIIQGTLHRIGWVRKHLAESGDSVRGIVLIERLDEELEYAAAAVADTIDFKTWRLSLAFESLPV